ncbi:endonuclease/exonuclease/phosphatase family protein, partial [Pseudomonas sp. UBA800]|uniref:endonuclease/exonuclease/phosphatase family protein n=1 Tax=Pseudomonas sp. UBA800 TaxID=1947344 RepID=UPI00257FEC03
GMNAVYDHGHHGNALLSSFRIENSHNHDVSDHAYEQRGILHCVLETPAGRVHCYVVHLGLFEGGRGRQTAQLIEAVQQSSHGEPVIIAGDFNDWRLKADAVLSRHLVEAFGKRCGALARSFPARLPLLRLDRIYLRNAVPEKAQVLSSYPWSHLSDHAPLAAEISL